MLEAQKKLRELERSGQEVAARVAFQDKLVNIKNSVLDRLNVDFTITTAEMKTLKAKIAGLENNDVKLRTDLKKQTTTAAENTLLKAKIDGLENKVVQLQSDAAAAAQKKTQEEEEPDENMASSTDVPVRRSVRKRKKKV